MSEKITEKTTRTRKSSRSEIVKMLSAGAVHAFGCDVKELTERQMYTVLSTVVRDMLTKKRKKFHDKYRENGDKQVYYMSMEFLVGTSLRNNIYNLGLEKNFASALESLGMNIENLYEMEPDAGLGNGGLGRLASCYLDSMTSLGIPATGFSIRYEFGIFKQKIIDGWQMEFPDDWLGLGDVWLSPREDECIEVKFGGEVHGWDDNGIYRVSHTNCDTVIAVPYDMYISGYGSEGVNKLVLWSAKSNNRFDMSAFSRGDYAKALEENTRAEVISKVLYPADDHIEGKTLRLKQQYLLVSASLQSIVKNHKKRYGTLDNLSDKAAIHINDTHPALCVPELMRILIDENGYNWEDAWRITEKTLAYTNHTVMSEALERWDEWLFREHLPRIYQIVAEINRRLLITLNSTYKNDIAKINYMSVIDGGEVRMANLCLSACHKINGVSKLHTEILKNGIFRDYYNLYPNKFINVTNGIAYRRWLCQANPSLSSFIEELIGDSFKTDSMNLQRLLPYQNDTEVLSRLLDIKRANKVRLAEYIAKANGINVNPDSIFDIQAKRLHEYKRQLLNILHVLYLYRKIKDNPNISFTPRTFIFAAKASAGYFMAKQIIRLIVTVSELVNSDPEVRDKLKVVFIEDYKVSLAEIIIPSADISEQISIAGKEASGTGNMKFMMNGALTVGTLDGANVEICEQVGEENMFLFGLRTHEVEELWKKGYNPHEYLVSNPHLKAVLDMLTSGELGAKFDDISRSLLTNGFGTADVYMILADFDSYMKAQEQVSETYNEKMRFASMSLINIAKSGIFSSDRSIREYCEKVWGVKIGK